MSPTGYDAPKAGLPVKIGETEDLQTVDSPAVDLRLELSDQAAPQVGLSTFMHAFRRRWLLSLLLGVACSLLAGVAAWFFFEVPSSAYALLRVSSQVPRLAFATSDNASRADFEIYKRTQKELIQSRFVLNAALRRQSLSGLPEIRNEPDPVVWLEKNLKVDFPGEAEIVKVLLSGDDAESLKQLVDSVVDAYISEVVDNERLQRKERLSSLSFALKAAQDKVRLKQEELVAKTKDLGSGDSRTLTVKQQIALQHFSLLRSEHTRVRFELMRAQIEAAALASRDSSNADADSIPAAAVEAGLETVPEIQHLRSLIAGLGIRILDDENLAKNKDHSSIRRYREQLAAAQKQLDAKTVELTPKVREFLKKRVAAAALEPSSVTDVTAARQKVEILSQEEKQLQAEVDQYAKEADAIGTSSVDVELLRSEMDRIGKIADQLSTEVETLTVEQQTQDRVIKIQEAVMQPTTIKERLRWYVSTAGATGLGFFCPIFAICWWETRSRRINSADEVTQLLGLRVIGSLPQMRNRVLTHMLIQDDEDLVDRGEVMRESLNSIRSMLFTSPEFTDTRVILVTSAVGGEGKTTLAVNLAASFARAGRRTLLLDCDLRRPAAHKLLDQPLEEGMSEILRGESDYFEVLRATATPNLWFISAGTGCKAAIESLLSGRSTLNDCVKRLRSEYDYIVLDACPILPVADGILLAQCVDAAVLSVRRDVSQAPLVAAAYKKLGELRISILGSVIAGVPERKYYRRYATAGYQLQT